MHAFGCPFFLFFFFLLVFSFLWKEREGVERVSIID
jgi:hypothetical protein